jgi:hypothetical protein
MNMCVNAASDKGVGGEVKKDVNTDKEPKPRPSKLKAGFLASFNGIQ